MYKRIYSQKEMDALTNEEINNITELYCYKTNVKAIPYLPKLEEFYCPYTKIKEIPFLPKLKCITCYFSKIKNILAFKHRVYLLNNKQLKIDCQVKTIEEWLELSDWELINLDNRLTTENIVEIRPKILDFLKENGVEVSQCK